MSDMEMRQAGIAEKDELFAMCDALREAAIPFVARDLASVDPNRIAMMTAAAGIFSGILFGELIAMGVAQDRDRKRVIDSLGKNFKSGVDIGKKHAFRVAEMLAGGSGNA